jgi:hypothetical protein
MEVRLMGIRKTTKLEVDGQTIELAVTELIPGRWGWVVKLDEQPLCSSPTPEVTFQAAYFAALSDLRRRYPDRAKALSTAPSQPPRGLQRDGKHPH